MIKRSIKINQFTKEVISEYLSGETTTILSKKYNMCVMSVYNILKKNMIPIRTHRKYRINETYFDTIDTPEKAYYLGLLYADGCNSTERGVVRIILSKTDKEILEKFSKAIFIDEKPLRLRKGGEFKDKNKTYIRQDSYELSISNKHMSLTLEKFGLLKAKSLIIKFPKFLNKSLYNHFIRGYFDGDGSISINKKQIQISILGTENFCLSLKKITDKLKIKSSICHAKNGSSIKQFVIHGNYSGRKFMSFIYDNSKIYLLRKFDKYQEILKIIPNSRPETCSLCENQHESCGYCKNHYYKLIGKFLRKDRYVMYKK